MEIYSTYNYANKHSDLQSFDFVMIFVFFAISYFDFLTKVNHHYE